MHQEPLVFTGPYMPHCFGAAYEVLTSAGVKDEAGAYPMPHLDTEDDANAALERQYQEYVKGASQVAIRRQRSAHQTNEGKWVANMRLVAFR